MPGRRARSLEARAAAPRRAPRRRAGGALQVAGARVVAEARPQVQHFIDRRRGERRHVGEARHEALVVRDDGGHLGLLQHDLRHPHPIGRAVDAAREDRDGPARACHSRRAEAIGERLRLRRVGRDGHIGILAHAGMATHSAAPQPPSVVAQLDVAAHGLQAHVAGCPRRASPRSVVARAVLAAALGLGVEAVGDVAAEGRQLVAVSRRRRWRAR